LVPTSRSPAIAASSRSGSRTDARARAYLLIVQLERCMNDQDHIDLPVDRAALLDTLAAVWSATLGAPESTKETR